MTSRDTRRDANVAQGYVDDTTDTVSNSDVASEPSQSSDGSVAPSGASTAAPLSSRSTPADVDLEVRVVCVGLMRTGLKSLHQALSTLGHAQIYDQEDIVSTYELWDDVLRNTAKGDIFPRIFQDAKVVIGMPAFCFWEQILARYPNARVILTVRDEDDWWKSVRSAKKQMDQELPGAPLRYGSMMRRIERFLMPSYNKFCNILRFAWGTTLGAQALEGDELNEFATRSSYRRHNAFVTSTLSKRKTEDGKRQLLVYDVRDGWGPLCQFLGSPVPEQRFPSDKRQGTGELSSTPSEMGHELEDMLVPESEFALRMRTELRRGLTISLAAFTVVVGSVLAVALTSFTELPVVVLALSYLAVIIASWTAYVVVHGLVMRVPALVVLPMAIKSLVIAACLQACFITYGILKEMIVTRDKIASPVLIMSARLMSVACGCVVMLLSEGRISFGGAPLHSFFAFGFTNEASTWAGYEMLKYVSFPVQVMAKSCKLLPNMIMGRVLNGTRYQWSQYFQAIGAMVCVTIMHLADEKDHKKSGQPKSSAADEEEMSDLTKTLIGVGLLVLFFAFDSFTSQWQTAIYKKHPKITQTQMMLAGNLVGVMISMGSVLSRWSAVSKSMGYAIANPEVIGRIILLGLSGALGQFCIYTAIKVLGPLAFTWIMTSRQLFSVLISLVMFGHGVSPTKLTCILTVFAIMSSKQLSRAVPQAMKYCKCKGRSRSEVAGGTETSKPQAREEAGSRPSRPRRLLTRPSQIWQSTPQLKKES